MTSALRTEAVWDRCLAVLGSEIVRLCPAISRCAHHPLQIRVNAMAVDYKRHGVEEILVEKCSRKLLQLELIVNCEICPPILHETRRVLIGKCGLTREISVNEFMCIILKRGNLRTCQSHPSMSNRIGVQVYIGCQISMSKSSLTWIPPGHCVHHIGGHSSTCQAITSFTQIVMDHARWIPIFLGSHSGRVATTAECMSSNIRDTSNCFAIESTVNRNCQRVAERM